MAMPLQLTQREASRGVKRTVEVPRRALCVMCRGHGGLPGGAVSSCGVCGGRGKIVRAEGAFQVTTPCSTCKGRRRIFSRPCMVCDATGGTEKKVRLEVSVPAGVSTGQRLRLKGQGHPALPPLTGHASETETGPPGDLYLDLVVVDAAAPAPAATRDDAEALLARELAATPGGPPSRATSGSIPVEARLLAGVVVSLAFALGYWLLSSR